MVIELPKRGGKVVDYFTTQYNFSSIFDIRVKDKDVRLIANGFSVMNKSNLGNFVFDYIDFFNKFYEKKEKKNNVLFLGNAAGSFIAGIINNCAKEKEECNFKFDVVEIDKKYTEIGEKYFGFPINDKRINFYYEDARTFINKNSGVKKYDLIFFDIFTAGSIYIPYYLMTREVFENLYLMTDTDGIVLINIVGSRIPGTKQKQYVNQFYTQVKSAFPQVILYNNDERNDYLTNYIVAAYKNPDSKTSKEIKEKLKIYEVEDIEEVPVIFTDKFSPVEKFM